MDIILKCNPCQKKNEEEEENKMQRYLPHT